MSQLQSSRERTVIIATCVVGVVVAAAVSLAIGAVVYAVKHPAAWRESAPQQHTAAYYESELHSRVNTAPSPEARYAAYWGTVCDATRDLGGSMTASDQSAGGQYELFTENAYGYYNQLVRGGKMPSDASARDGARFAAGRSVCDFM